jgi:anti-anti-sigma regulatory factor/anti-sigma regulatory factor (Ser/Thr protein kinase)
MNRPAWVAGETSYRHARRESAWTGQLSMVRSFDGSGSAATPALESLVEARLPVAVIRLRGRLDLATVSEVRRTLGMSLAEHPSAIVVDLTELTLGDDVALTVFSTFAMDAADWPGCRVALVAPTAAVAAGIERLGVGRQLSVYADRRQALAAAGELPAPRQQSRRLYPTPIATRVARQLVAEACRAWGVTDITESAEIIITELVSNVVVHAGTEMRVRVALGQSVLRLSVRDHSPTLPRRVLPDPETGEGGRGLILIEALSTGWGVTATEDGKLVWATLRTDRSGRAARSRT